MITHARIAFKELKTVIPPTPAANLTSTYGKCYKTISCVSATIRIHPTVTATTVNGFLLSAGESLDVLCDDLYIATSNAGTYQCLVWE